MSKGFVPFHINASVDDFKINNGLPRYIILCGSDERAAKISKHFEHLTIKKSTRNHHLYLGTLPYNNISISIGAISTGMGTPSADIIINELFLLGARRFLRIGTAGSLQPFHIKTGSLVVATAAVRDEDTSRCYIYPEFPAIATPFFTAALMRSAHHLGYSKETFQGIVHTKSSLYAREMNQSFLKENKDYMANMRKAGVLATEMECSQLFILSSLLQTEESVKMTFRRESQCGAILAIIGDNTPITMGSEPIAAIDKAIEIGITAIKILASEEGINNT